MSLSDSGGAADGKQENRDSVENIVTTGNIVN